MEARHARRGTAWLLAGLIFLGSLGLVGIPFGWLWLISQLNQPYTTIYLLALIGCPTMMIAWGMVLTWLDRSYRERSADRTAPPVLEATITLAVVLTVLLLAAWLLLYGERGGPMQGPWPG